MKVQVYLNLETQAAEGQSRAVNSVFQVAELIRPLMSVSQICDHGCKCVSERDHAMVVFPEGKTLCLFERQSGLYVRKMSLKWLTPFGRREPYPRSVQHMLCPQAQKLSMFILVAIRRVRAPRIKVRLLPALTNKPLNLSLGFLLRAARMRKKNNSRTDQ